MRKDISYKRIWVIACPIILGSIAQNLINFTDTAFLDRVGEVALGAGALGGIFYLAVFMLGLGFGMGEQIIVARRYGEKRLKEIGSVVDHRIILLCFVGVVALVSLGMAFPRLLLGIYTNNQMLINMGIPVLHVVSVGALLLSIGFILFSAVSGTGKTNISLAIELTVLVVYLFYTYFMVEHWHGTVILAWTAEWVYGSLLSLFSFIYLKSNRWKKALV